MYARALSVFREPGIGQAEQSHAHDFPPPIIPPSQTFENPSHRQSCRVDYIIVNVFILFNFKFSVDFLGFPEHILPCLLIFGND